MPRVPAPTCLMKRLRLLVTQGDPVGLGDVVGIDGPQSLAQPLTSLAQELKRVAGGTLRGGAVWISPVFLDEVGLQRCSDFVGRLQRMINGPVPCDVVYHAASIPHRGPHLATLACRGGCVAWKRLIVPAQSGIIRRWIWSRRGRWSA